MYVAAIVVAAATPIAPPICWLVLISPEAIPASAGFTPVRARVPIVARRRESGGEPRLWSAIVDCVLRRPLASVVAAGGLLLALAIPAFGLHTSVPGRQGLPQGLPIVKTLKRIETAFPGGPFPAYVVIQGSHVTSPRVRTAVGDLERHALASGQMHEPTKAQTNRQRNVAVVSIPLSGKGTDSASYRALDTLRQDVIPATVGSLPGVKAQVTGITAQSKDFNDSMKSHAPIVFAFVLTMAFLLLLVTFRSIVRPITAIVLNLLSVGAADGALVLVFQHTWAQGLLGFKSTGAITSWRPLFLFVILFGLSMD